MVGPALRQVNAALGRRALVWAAVTAATGVALCFVPLFDVLGYDYAFALGILTAFSAVDLGHGAAAAARRRDPAPSLARVLAIAIAASLGVLVVPLLASLFNALRVRNCSFGAGLAFFALLPASTAIYGAVWGALAGLASRRRGRLLALLVPVVSIGWTLVRLYFDPPVFAFDPFGGYFPGPIYDEAMRPPAQLAIFRAVNALWLAAAIALFVAVRDVLPAWRAGQRRRAVLTSLMAALLVAGSAGAFAARGALGVHVRHVDLARALDLRLETPHFVVYADRAALGSPAEIALLEQDLEFRYQQLARVLGVEPDGRITVYQFPSAAVKKALVGAGGTLYAKPWKREIFVQVDRFPAGRLRHELAHVFAGAFGDPIFGVSFAWRWRGPIPVPRLASGLIEGIAEAADYGDPEGRATIHQEARAIVADGRAPPLDAVVGAGFSTLSGARAYTLAGSFCHFLLATRGAPRLRALYRSAGDFERVYGAPLGALESEWRAFLGKQPLDERERARAKERFRRGAIFQKVCARELAARVASARERMYAEPTAAVALLESVCRDDPHEPTFRLELAEARAAAGATPEALREAAAIEADEELTVPLRARAANLAAAIHFHAGRFDDARAATTRARAFATDDGEIRTLEVKLRALESAFGTRTLGRVLFGDSPSRGLDGGLVVHLVGAFAARFPQDALGPYLVGRQLAHRDPALAVEPLAEACPTEGEPRHASPLPPPFRKECLRLLGEVAFRAGDLARAEAAYARARAEAQTEAERLRATDFLERIAWTRGRAVD